MAHLLTTGAQVALSWTQLEPKLALIGHVDLKPAPKPSKEIEMDPSHVMHMDVQVVCNLRQFRTLQRQLTPP